MTPDMHEPVGLEFRGRSRFLPILSLATAFRRGVAEVARALVVLIDGPDADLSEPESMPDGEGGKGGGERSETFGSETLDPKPNESERERSETFGRAHAREDDLATEIATVLDDEDNVGAIRKLIGLHPEPLVRDALTRTLAIPADRIRGSRGAIFTGIVRKLARERTTPTP